MKYEEYIGKEINGIRITDYKKDETNGEWKLFIHCEKCGYDNKVYPWYFFKTKKCARCDSNKVITRGVNDIATTHPEFLKYFIDKEQAYTHSWGCPDRTDFICPDCGEIKHNFQIVTLIKKGFKCQKCGDGISYPNKFIRSLLTQLNVNFESEKVAPWNNRQRFDCFLTDYNIAIEMDGGYHYLNEGRGVKTLEHDKIKNEESIKHSIYILRIDCNYPAPEKRFDYIKNSIINSNLFNILNADKYAVNWNKCGEDSTKNIFKVVCKMFNETHSINKISESLNMSVSTIKQYVRTGGKIGMCDYITDKWDRDGVLIGSEEYKSKVGKRIRKTSVQKKKVICITTNEIFESAGEAAEHIGLKSGSGISAVCSYKGRKMTSGVTEDGRRMKWMYYEDYINAVNLFYGIF